MRMPIKKETYMMRVNPLGLTLIFVIQYIGLIPTIIFGIHRYLLHSILNFNPVLVSCDLLFNSPLNKHHKHIPVYRKICTNLHGLQYNGARARLFSSQQQIFVNLSTKLSTFVMLYNFLLWSRL